MTILFCIFVFLYFFYYGQASLITFEIKKKCFWKCCPGTCTTHQAAPEQLSITLYKLPWLSQMIHSFEVGHLATKLMINFSLHEKIMTRFRPIFSTGFRLRWYLGYMSIFQLCSSDKLRSYSMVELIMKMYCIRKIILIVYEQSDLPTMTRTIWFILLLEMNLQFFILTENPKRMYLIGW